MNPINQVIEGTMYMVKQVIGQVTPNNLNEVTNEEKKNLVHLVQESEEQQNSSTEEVVLVGVTDEQTDNLQPNTSIVIEVPVDLNEASSSLVILEEQPHKEPVASSDIEIKESVQQQNIEILDVKKQQEDISTEGNIPPVIIDEVEVQKEDIPKEVVKTFEQDVVQNLRRGVVTFSRKNRHKKHNNKKTHYVTNQTKSVDKNKKK